MKNKKQTKNKQYHKDAKKATHNGSRSIQRFISWKKKIKKRERKSLGLKFGSKREEKIKEHGKEYRKIDINGCLMIREKCKRVHERIQCIEKKNNSKLIWVGMYWNILESMWWYGQTEVTKEDCVQHGEDEFHFGLSDGTVWRAKRQSFCEKNEVFCWIE